MINHPDDIGFPNCGQCHEDLIRCTSCRHAEAASCRHPHGRTRFAAFAPENATRCPHFRARTEERQPSWRITVPAPVWVSAMMLLILVMLGSAIWFIDPTGRVLHGNPLRLETTVPRQVIAGQPFNITMRFTNILPQVSTRIFVEVSGGFLSVAEPGMPTPPPVRYSRTGDRLVFEYQPLPSGGQRVVQLPFVARNTGTAPFVARVYAPENQLRQEVRVPIEVVQRVGVVLDHPEGKL